MCSLVDGGPLSGSCQIHGPALVLQSESTDELSDSNKSPVLRNPAFSHSACPPEVHKSCFCVRFIAEHTKMLEDSTKVSVLVKYLKDLVLCCTLLIQQPTSDFLYRDSKYWYVTLAIFLNLRNLKVYS
jgi:hypothetical protein